MKVIKIIKLFLPPLYYRVKGMIKEGHSFWYDQPSQKSLVYDCIREISDRRNLRLTDVAGLSKEMSFKGMSFLAVGYDEPGYYGDFYELQKYAQIQVHNFPPKMLNLQHGILCDLLEFEYTKLNNVNFVWSPKIKQLFQKHTDNPHFYVIGSPFFYVDSLLSKEEVELERKRLGKNLLAFPSHSVYYADVKYDASGFINLLKEQRKKFDSVRVCIYWRDYQRGLAKVYEDAGFECVCCGHIYDPFFLERQKALLEIADATISNAVGSYVGHSVYLNKPHWMIPEKHEFKDIDKNGFGKRESDFINSSPNYQQLRETFAYNSDYKITQAHRDVVDEYWGVSCIKTPEEIRSLIEKAYDVSEELCK